MVGPVMGPRNGWLPENESCRAGNVDVTGDKLRSVMSYDEVIADVARVVESVGVAIMVLGGLAALLVATVAVARAADRSDVYMDLRRNLGRAILLGLEVLIIGDIVRTIVVDPTLNSVAVLGVIVLIRIVLSFSLELELDGARPWTARGRPSSD